MNNATFGKKGEIAALKYIKKKGYKVLNQNFKTAIGEIDIIAKHKDTVVFIEVKSRTDDNMGMPSQAVNYHKQKKISLVACQYLKQNNLFGTSCRFDVIEICGGEINHIQNAFQYIK